MISPIQKKLYLAYLVFLACSTIYIYYLLKNNTVEIQDLPKKEVLKESKEVATNLQVEMRGSTVQSYSVKMTSQDNVNDLLNKVLAEHAEFKFEKTLLISGTRFDQVSGVGGNWKLLDSKNNEIKSPEDTLVQSNITYKLVL